jgi:hypothetical protein
MNTRTTLINTVRTPPALKATQTQQTNVRKLDARHDQTIFIAEDQEQNHLRLTGDNDGLHAASRGVDAAGAQECGVVSVCVRVCVVCVLCAALVGLFAKRQDMQTNTR